MLLTWGTHFGETKDPASISRTPVLARRSINSHFVWVVMVFSSFCNPSRGPTSTTLTSLAVFRCSVAGVAVAVAYNLLAPQRNRVRATRRGSDATRTEDMLEDCRITSHMVINSLIYYSVQHRMLTAMSASRRSSHHGHLGRGVRGKTSMSRLFPAQPRIAASPKINFR
jgi:hypothetical protein